MDISLPRWRRPKVIPEFESCEGPLGSSGYTLYRIKKFKDPERAQNWLEVRQRCKSRFSECGVEALFFPDILIR